MARSRLWQYARARGEQGAYAVSSHFNHGTRRSELRPWARSSMNRARHAARAEAYKLIAQFRESRPPFNRTSRGTFAHGSARTLTGGRSFGRELRHQSRLAIRRAASGGIFSYEGFAQGLLYKGDVAGRFMGTATPGGSFSLWAGLCNRALVGCLAA